MTSNTVYIMWIFFKDNQNNFSTKIDTKTFKTTSAQRLILVKTISRKASRISKVSQMALSVKAYLLLDPDLQEIRRFTIDEGPSYDNLLTKIRTVFPVIRNKPLRLFWKDHDEELVAFSSHEELAEALGNMKGDAFWVFVKVNDSQVESVEQVGSNNVCTPSSPEPVHEGIVCNGCETGNFTGTRFKCGICRDYNLCNRYEARGLQKEHEMLRICNPRGCQGFTAPLPYTSLTPCGHHGHHHGCGPWVRGCHGPCR